MYLPPITLYVINTNSIRVANELRKKPRAIAIPAANMVPRNE